MPNKPLALIILDGWGYREAQEYNAIAKAKTPHWDKLWRSYPHCTLSGSGLDVGLPEGQMGNSEVGHLTMGAGRRTYQDLTRISEAIKEGSFFQNPILKAAFHNPAALHILGLLSPGGVHSHENHIYALIEYAKQNGVKQIYLHCFLDGRDTPPQSAETSLLALEKYCHGFEGVKIASIVGRYYAMDRDKRYERTEQAYQLLVEGKAPYYASSAIEALKNAYNRGETDEFVAPTFITAITTITEQPIENQSFKMPSSADSKSVLALLPGTIKDNDVVIFMNFRSDRARQLSYALSDPNFHGFKRSIFPKLAAFVTLTEYAKDIKAEVAFPVPKLHNMLGEFLQAENLRQLRIAETEKYAHVTFFFNGGREKPFIGEERILVPSKRVATYDLLPEMSAIEVTDKLVEAILHGNYDVIICNFANADMVGHTGNFVATVNAIEVLDICLARITEALQKVGGEALITADHGNAEYMFDAHTKQPHTAHTESRVPFIYIGRPAECIYNDGVLADIAPTMITLLGLKKPKEMTGRSLIELRKNA